MADKKSYKKTTVEAKPGALLISEPYMMDPHFYRSVLLLCDRHPDGCFGLILNKPLGLKIEDLLKPLGDFSAPVYYGGPVQTDNIYYLHTQGDLIQDSIQVDKGLYCGGNFEQLLFCIHNELITPRDVRFFVGYSGWDEDQFQAELDEVSWLVAPGDQNYVFKDYPDLWKMVLEHEGGSFGVIAQMDKPVYN